MNINLSPKAETQIALVLFFIGLLFVVFSFIKFANPQSSYVEKLTQTSLRPLTAEEVAQHNSLTDCYLIINQKVYDLTKYINLHPGGSKSITNFCGQEASQAFNTMGGKGSHSQFAIELLVNYFIAPVGQVAVN